MNTELFHFIRPSWLLAIIPFLLAVIWLYRQQGQQSNWQRVVDSELLPYLIQDARESRRIWPIILLSFTGILAITALAGPTWERIPEPVFRSDAATVIVLDLSRSMDAQDIKPSRLERARFKVADILNAKQDGQTALIVYAADAFTVTPLTDDDETILSQLSALTTDLPPAQGSRIDRALELATRLLKQASQTEGHILLITDEVERTSGMAAAAQLAAQGYKLSILGVGTEEGAPIPVRGGMLKNSAGEIVFAKLNRRDLEDIAAAGQGDFALLSHNDRDITSLKLDEPAALEDTEETDDLTADKWKEFGPWLLLPVLLIASLAFRRGILVLVFVVIMPLPQPAEAFEWQDLWQTPDQQGQALFKQEQHLQAAENFKDPAWRGSSLYKSGHYEQALQDFSNTEGADARYNEGNTLAKLGRYEEAMNAYNKALAENPEHEDAKHNKQLVEEFLKQQENQNSDQNEESDQGSQEQSEQQDQSSSEQSDNEQQQESQSTDSQQDKEQQSTPQQQSDNQDANNENQPSEDTEQQQAEQEDSPQQDQEQTSENEVEQEQIPQQADSESEPQQNAEQTEPTVTELNEEQQLAKEQWLNRIPDNPAVLLKRKFQYQYKQRARTDGGEKPW